MCFFSKRYIKNGNNKAYDYNNDEEYEFEEFFNLVDENNEKLNENAIVIISEPNIFLDKEQVAKQLYKNERNLIITKNKKEFVKLSSLGFHISDGLLPLFQLLNIIKEKHRYYILLKEGKTDIYNLYKTNPPI
jgi:hypothetical protein